MASDKGFERLSTEDELFVNLDYRRMQMTIALLAIFEDRGADFDQILAAIGGRLHLVPRLRRKLMRVSLGLGRSVWVDDEGFDLRYHVRHIGLPRPGERQDLLDLASLVFGLPLDLDKPLWEMWIVDLPDDRKAMLVKCHHSLADGISAIDLSTLLFDQTRKPGKVQPVPHWRPQAPPSGATLLRDTVITNVSTPLGAARRLLDSARKPARALRVGTERARGLESFLASSLAPTARTSLDQHVVDPYRRLETVTAGLAGLKVLRRRCGATVNDVVLAATAGGLGHLLRSRGEDTTGLRIRAVIPVSTRADDEHFTYGNMIAAMVVELPIGERDPWKCLEQVQRSTEKAKSTKQAAAIRFVAGLADMAPDPLITVAGRLAVMQPMYDLVVTNVPGPVKPLYFVGGKILEMYFFGPNLIERTDLAVAVMSYAGQLNFGLTGDRTVLPDVKILAEGITSSLDAYGNAPSGTPASS